MKLIIAESCDCGDGAAMIEGLKVYDAKSQKDAARYLKKKFMAKETHYIAHLDGKHILFAHMDGHWWPHLGTCEAINCNN